jgi:hypothetical protein
LLPMSKPKGTIQMKKLLLIAGAALTLATASAQNRQPSFICSYYGEPITAPVMGFSSSSEAKNIINRIIDVIGLQSTFETRSANIPNAAAVVQSGKRYILYNPNFISSVERAAGDKWASIAILAHEIGHHLNGHTIAGMGSRPSIELEADEFSGFVLRKMGASLSQAQLAMKVAADQRTSATHPGKTDRLNYIAYGWNKADAQMSGRPVANRPVYNPQSSRTASANTVVLSDKHIAYDVVFNADRTNKYYITTGNNLIKVHSGQGSVVAKLVSTGRQQYPWMLYASAADYFLIDRQSRVLTSAGQAIGYVRKH